LLNDALNVAIMMCLKFQQDIMNHVILDNMINDEIGGYSNVKLAYLIYKFTCIPVCDVTFCCIIIFYVSAAEPAIGKNIFV